MSDVSYLVRILFSPTLLTWFLLKNLFSLVYNIITSRCDCTLFFLFIFDFFPQTPARSQHEAQEEEEERLPCIDKVCGIGRLACHEAVKPLCS